MNYNVSIQSVDYDTRGSLYACGSQDNDPTETVNIESQKAVVFKLMSLSTGLPSLEWLQILEPNQYGPPGQKLNDYENYTTCDSISWLGNKTQIDNFTPPTGYVVFVGNSVKVDLNGNSGTGTTGCRVCYIASLKDDDVNTVITSRLVPDCSVCEQTLADPNSIDTAFILINTGDVIIARYQASQSWGQIIQQTRIRTNVTIVPIDLVYSKDLKRLFFLGQTYSFKFSKNNLFQDCLVMSVDSTSVLGVNTGAYFGTEYNDKCKSISTNRYDWQIVTTTTHSSTLANEVCHIMLMNQYHSLIWSKEFGRSSNDQCPDAEISHDGFVTFIVGQFISTATPANGVQMYILVLSTVNGAQMRFREFGGTRPDKIKAMKLYHNTLFIAGDVQTWYAGALGQTNTGGVNCVSSFAMRINVDLKDIDCFRTNQVLTTTLFRDNTGFWKSSDYLFPFTFSTTTQLSQKYNDTLSVGNSSWSGTFSLFQFYPQTTATYKLIYSCATTSYFDQQVSPDLLNADSETELAHQLMSFCTGSIPAGINEVTLTNYTVFPNPSGTPVIYINDSSNMYGFFFEKAKNQINGVPLTPGDFGIRYAYSDAAGYGFANYAFARIKGTGLNVMNNIYMTDSLYLKDFVFQLDESEIFTSLLIPIVSYQIEVKTETSWMKVNNTLKQIYGIPNDVPNCSVNQDGYCTFLLTAIDATGGSSSSTVSFKVKNNQPIMMREETTDVVCARKNQNFYYQVLFDKYFNDADYQILYPIVTTNSLANFQIPGLYFDTQLKMIFGSPTLNGIYRLLFQSTDTKLISSGIYGLQIEVIPLNPYNQALCTSPINLHELSITRQNFEINKEIDYSKCLPKTSPGLDSSQYYILEFADQNLNKLFQQNSLSQYLSFNLTSGLLSFKPKLLQQTFLQLQLKISLIDSSYYGNCFKYTIISQITLETPMKLQTNATVLMLTAYKNEYFYLGFEDFQQSFIQSDFQDYRELYFIEKLSTSPPSFLEMQIDRTKDQMFSQLNIIDITNITQKLVIHGYAEDSLIYSLNQTGIIYEVYDYTRKNIQQIEIQVQVLEREQIQIKQDYIDSLTKMLYYEIDEEEFFSLIIPIDLFYTSSQNLVQNSQGQQIILSIQCQNLNDSQWLFYDYSVPAFHGKAPEVSNNKIVNFTIYAYSDLHNQKPTTLQGQIMIIDQENIQIQPLQTHFTRYITQNIPFTIDLSSFYNFTYKNQSSHQIHQIQYESFYPTSVDNQYWPIWLTLDSRQGIIQGMYISEHQLWEQYDQKVQHLWISAKNYDNAQNDINQTVVIQLDLIISQNDEIRNLDNFSKNVSTAYLFMCLALTTLFLSQILLTHIFPYKKQVVGIQSQNKLNFDKQRQQIMSKVFRFKLREQMREELRKQNQEFKLFKEKGDRLKLEREKQRKSQYVAQDELNDLDQSQLDSQSSEQQQSQAEESSNDLNDSNSSYYYDEEDGKNEDSFTVHNIDKNQQYIKEERSTHQSYLDYLRNRIDTLDQQSVKPMGQNYQSPFSNISRKPIEKINMLQDTNMTLMRLDDDNSFDNLPYQLNINSQNEQLRMPNQAPEQARYNLSDF
eukprot:403374508